MWWGRRLTVGHCCTISQWKREYLYQGMNLCFSKMKKPLISLQHKKMLPGLSVNVCVWIKKINRLGPRHNERVSLFYYSRPANIGKCFWVPPLRRGGGENSCKCSTPPWFFCCPVQDFVAFIVLVIMLLHVWTNRRHSELINNAVPNHFSRPNERKKRLW